MEIINIMVESSPPPRGPSKLTKEKIFLTSTVLALLISLPAIAIALIMHHIIKTELLLTVLISLIGLFITMGFSIKISKKLSNY
jgi:ABC-type bacteriocin/lantibiotic exporter with double-glycine peptidase domain